MEEIQESYIDGNGNIVISDVTGSTITINRNDTAAINKILSDLNSNLKSLSLDVLKVLEEKSMKTKRRFKSGANLYLTVLAAVNIDNAKTRAISWGTTITNLTKEIRYFNQPYFKVYPKFTLDNGLEHDTFLMTNGNGVGSPHRLEFGQTLDVDFPVNPAALELYEG